MDTRAFIGIESSLELYNGQPLLNFPFEFITCDDLPFELDGTEGFLRVYNERGDSECDNLILRITLTVSGNLLIANEAAIRLPDAGRYYYEIGYLQGGLYDIVLRYGMLRVH